MFGQHLGKEMSLLDISGDLYDHYDLEVKKQSIDGRFNEKAVAFMKAVLTRFLEYQFKTIDSEDNLTCFNRVRIKDSTRFALPPAFAQVYTGYGGATANSESMISIQYEYDLLSSNTLDLRLTSGTQNDQLDAKENTHHIAKNDLFIRDLGYSTLNYLSQIAANEAYFVNRLNPQTTVYHADKPEVKIDFDKCLKKMKKHNLHNLEYKVVMGKKAQLPCRLVIYPVDNDTYQKRIRKTTKQAKSYGHQVSDDYKLKAQLTLYITNVEKEKIHGGSIKKVYSLRWQIELIFKIWKSQAKIDKVKKMKIHRFECQLISRLVWLMIHWKILKYLTDWVNSKHPGESCSP